MNIATSLRTAILKNICEQLLLNNERTNLVFSKGNHLMKRCFQFQTAINEIFLKGQRYDEKNPSCPGVIKDFISFRNFITVT